MAGGVPGGDDYQNIWINPNNPDIILLGSDQGAIVTVNGGKSWSSWYNQSTAQLYHVSADTSFPYRVCNRKAVRLESKARGDEGGVTFRDRTSCGRGIWLCRCRSVDPDIIIGVNYTIRSSNRSGTKHSSGSAANGRFSDVVTQ